MKEFAILASIVSVLSGNVTSSEQSSKYVTKVLSLAFPMLKNTFHLEACDWFDLYDAGWRQERRLRLNGRAPSAFLHDLNELKGAVTISDANVALRYVRLITAYSTFMLWKSDNCRLEIVPASKWRELPNYGLKAECDPDNTNSGFMAVLSAVAYQQGKFTPPVVETTPNGFAIRRWIMRVDCSNRPEKCYVEEIEEQVDREGSYHCRILHSKKAPKLSDTDWTIQY